MRTLSVLTGREMRIAIMAYSSLVQRKVLPALALLNKNANIIVFTRRKILREEREEAIINNPRIQFEQRSRLLQVARGAQFDMVYISSANIHHFEDLMDAAKLNVPTFVDKPAFISNEEKDQVLKIFKSKEQLLDEVETWQLHEQVDYLKEYIKRLKGNIDICSVFTVPLFDKHNYRLSGRPGSGVFHDMNAYLYSTLELFGLQQLPCIIEMSQSAGAYAPQWFTAAVKSKGYNFNGLYGFGFDYANKLVATDGTNLIELKRMYTSSSNEPTKVVTYSNGKILTTMYATDTFKAYLKKIFAMIKNKDLYVEERLNRLSAKYKYLSVIAQKNPHG